jgi:outer membrane cobalamin receptor
MQRILFISAAGLIMPGVLWSAVPPEAGLSEVTVRGNLEVTLPQELAKVGNDVHVVDGETLRDGGFVDVAQALEKTVPGLYLQPSHGPFSYTDVSLQGSRRGDVLWVVDGVRINNRLYNTTSPNDTIPSALIERIEVLKDGQGLYYGTQAVAGVINVVTRGLTDEFGGNVTLGGSTNESWDASGYARGAAGAHKFLGFVSYNRSEGYTPFDVMQSSARDRKRGYDVRSLGGKYGFDFSEDLHFTASWQHTNAAVEQLSRPYGWGHSANRRDQDLVTARLDYDPEGAVKLSLKGYLHDWDTRITTAINNGSAPYVPIVSDDNAYWGFKDYGVSSLAQLSLIPAFDTFVGYDFQNYSGKDEVLLIAEQTETVHAVFAQVRTTEELSARARFALGARYNRASENQTTTVWNASGRVNLVGPLYVASVLGTAFRLPDAYELYAIDPFDTRGNPDLKGEKSRNLNVSLGADAGDLPMGIAWQITGFWRTVQDLITTVDDGTDNGVFANVDQDVKTRGFEAQVGARLSRTLSGNLSYTYARTRPEGSTLQLERAPESYFKSGLQYVRADERLGAGITGYFLGDRFQTVAGFGRRQTGHFSVFDLDAHLRFGEGNRHRVNAKLENALGRDYATGATRGFVDGTGAPYVATRLGVPRTLHVNYSLDF